MDPRKSAGEVARELETALGERLDAVLLYGSVARGEFNAAFSDINLLILLDRIDTGVLRALAGIARGWPERRVRPMLLEQREWTRAADAFAVELLDMKDAHELLAGRDPVAEAVVQPAAARLQTERELRSRIIHLHNGMVNYAHDPETLGELLMAALPSFATYLRTALRLADEQVRHDMEGLITQGTRLVRAPAEGLLAAYEARSRARPWKVGLDDPLLEQYAAAAEATARYVDTWEEGRA